MSWIDEIIEDNEQHRLRIEAMRKDYEIRQLRKKWIYSIIFYIVGMVIIFVIAEVLKR